jgi:hypothetical protein
MRVAFDIVSEKNFLCRPLLDQSTFLFAGRNFKKQRKLEKIKRVFKLWIGSVKERPIRSSRY